jgi:hypothetical protein
MTTTPRMDLNRLVAQIVLDVALLHWFANHDRRVAALSAIAETRRAKGPHAVLDFLTPKVAGSSPVAPARDVTFSSPKLVAIRSDSAHRSQSVRRRERTAKSLTVASRFAPDRAAISDRGEDTESSCDRPTK